MDPTQFPLQTQADNSKQVPTLSGQFRQSLDSLVKALSDCQPFFIRCIRPNDKRQPKVSDTDQQPQLPRLDHDLWPERRQTVIKIRDSRWPWLGGDLSYDLSTLS